MPEAQNQTVPLESFAQNATERPKAARYALVAAGALGLVAYGLAARRRAPAEVTPLPRAGKRPYRFSLTIQRPAEEVKRLWMHPEGSAAAETGNLRGDRITRRLCLFRPELVEYAETQTGCEWRLVDTPSLRGELAFEPCGSECTRVTVKVTNLRHQTRVRAAAKSLLFHSLTKEVREDCFRMKQLLETGEIATTVGQSVGTC